MASAGLIRFTVARGPTANCRHFQCGMVGSGLAPYWTRKRYLPGWSMTKRSRRSSFTGAAVGPWSEILARLGGLETGHLGSEFERADKLVLVLRADAEGHEPRRGSGLIGAAQREIQVQPVRHPHDLAVTLADQIRRQRLVQTR